MQHRSHGGKQSKEPLCICDSMWASAARVHTLTCLRFITPPYYLSTLPPSDDYNRVLLRLDEGRSHDSAPDDDEEEESSDEEEDDSAKYINASYMDVWQCLCIPKSIFFFYWALVW